MQKIRTVELDGKVIKLQIVSGQNPEPIFISTLDFSSLNCCMPCSGIQLDKSASGPSLAATTEAHMASL